MELGFLSMYDEYGDYLTSWGSTRTGASQFWWPSTVRVDSYGDVYVSDFRNNRILKSDSNGNFVRQWRGNGVGDG